MTIVYVKGNLLDAPSSEVLLHACNCQGNWGKGVAKAIADAYPQCYAFHQRNAPYSRGYVQLIHSPIRDIICLFTSKGFGRYVDDPGMILASTQDSLVRLATYFNGNEVTIASPLINGGLFNVPWEHTEALIESFLANNPNFTWKVYKL
ncbi:MAG: hypothetical protein EHM12_09990 [Dehalococcoidia bacterium]|nr:MAG: hypothetical protein EHM12_09990 [Dehalococcoidia bacterium]